MKLYDKITEIIFPPRCPVCDKILSVSFPVCDNCKGFVVSPEKSQAICGCCFQYKKECVCIKHQFFEKFSFSFFYDKPVSDSIIQMKYYSRPDKTRYFAKQMEYSLKEREMLSGVHFICFVPMRFSDRIKRGYNQSYLMAKELSKLTKIPCLPIFKKCFKTKRQQNLKYIERTGNLFGVFNVKEKFIKEIEGKTVLIVDDISTSRSTFNELSKTLLAFGANLVYVSCCAAVKFDNVSCLKYNFF